MNRQQTGAANTAAFHHLDSWLYAEARKMWSKVHTDQILKGAQKYPEPLNPDSWTAEELIYHAMQENIDQFHYLTALLMKVREQREREERQAHDDQAGDHGDPERL